MKRYSIIITSFLLLFIIGCAIPIPHQRLHEYGVKSKLIDEETHLPINDAIIFSISRDDKFVRTDKNGDFSLPPIYGWHGGYFIGPISLSFWPGFDMAAHSRSFLICAPEYKVTKKSIDEHESPKDDFIEIREISIKK